MARLLIDTDILIDVADENTIAINRLKLESQNSILAISSITVMELLVGCRNKQEQRSLERFLDKFQIVLLSNAISA